MRTKAVFWILVTLLVTPGCSSNNAKRHFVLAEKLWAQESYGAAVAEFERASRLDPKGKLGLQALFRAAVTQSLFLHQHDEALSKLETFIRDTEDAESSWQAQLQVGEILYERQRRYDQAVVHYRMLLRLRPKAEEAPELTYRIARALFLLSRFGEAQGTYLVVEKEYPKSEWAEKSLLDRAQVSLTRASQITDAQDPDAKYYREAIGLFGEFINKYPQSDRVSEARFGIANCLEELNELEAAMHTYEQILSIFPAPKAVATRIARIQERLGRKSK